MAGRLGNPWKAAGLAAVVAIVLSGTSLTAPAAEVADDPFRLLQEQSEVMAASRRPQPMSETPSIVSVITAAEIRTHGYRTLGEALQWVRGLYTRYDRNYVYLGVRGVQRPGDYNNKVLLTIDGHTMNSPIYGDAAFGPELGLDMESVKRIEIIRGPGSALYGSNAVLAVVNVVTWQAPASAPLQAGGGAGSFGERRAWLALASGRPGLPQLTLNGSWSGARGVTPDWPGYSPALALSGQTADPDGEQRASVFTTLSWQGARLAVKFNERTKHIPTGAYGTRLGDPNTRTRDGHDFVELSQIAQPAAAVELTTRAWWDGSRYWGSYAFGPDSGVVTNRDVGYSDLIGAEIRLNWRPLPRHVTSLGIEGRRVTRALQSNTDLNPYTLYTFTDTRSNAGSFFVQDEMQLAGRARMTAGARIDGDSRRSTVVSPRLDLRVPLGEVTTWKVLAGNAYRAPVPYETYYTAPPQVANANLLPERVNTVETAIEHRIGEVQLLVSGYRNWIRDLIDTVVLDTLGNASFTNLGHVRSTGVEAEMQWSPGPAIEARGDLGWQESIDLVTRTRLTNSPPWNAHLVLTAAPGPSPMRLGAGLRWLGPRTTLRGSRLANVALVDARIAFLPRAPIELGLETRNLFNAHYSDPAAAEHAQDALTQDERGLFFTFAVRRSAAP